MRLGDLAGAIKTFEEAIALLPDYAEAIAARAESLDMLGQSRAAAPEYEKARRLWAGQRTGAPDRSYLYRQHGRFSFEVDSYELALRRIKTGAFPHLACGNVLLAQGYAAEALECYEQALKIKRDNPNLMALKGEALSMMGKYTPAIQAFDFALAAQPNAPEVLNARGIAKAALGAIAEANADWRRQLELLGPARSPARAYVYLRLADYEAALPEIERSLASAPSDPYWHVYRIAALRRLGRPSGFAEPPMTDGWPAQLIGLLDGKSVIEDVLRQASSPMQRAEAYFQLAVAETDGADARKRWKQVIDEGTPSLIEYGAALNELARLGS